MRPINGLYIYIYKCYTLSNIYIYINTIIKIFQLVKWESAVDSHKKIDNSLFLGSLNLVA